MHLCKAFYGSTPFTLKFHFFVSRQPFCLYHRHSICDIYRSANYEVTLAESLTLGILRNSKCRKKTVVVIGIAYILLHTG